MFANDFSATKNHHSPKTKNCPLWPNYSSYQYETWHEQRMYIPNESLEKSIGYIKNSMNYFNLCKKLTI